MRAEWRFAQGRLGLPSVTPATTLLVGWAIIMGKGTLPQAAWAY